MKYRAALWMVLVLALQGCSSWWQPRATDSGPDGQILGQQRAEHLLKITGFTLQGKLAVTGAPLSGNLRWQQEGSHFVLRLTGPFGAGAMELSGVPEAVRIRSKDQDILTQDAEGEIARITGLRLPLAALRYWVLGVAAPENPASTVFDAQGRPISLQQLGWTVEFEEFDEQVPALPRRLRTQQGDWVAALIVSTLALLP